METSGNIRSHLEKGVRRTALNQKTFQKRHRAELKFESVRFRIKLNEENMCKTSSALIIYHFEKLM